MTELVNYTPDDMQTMYAGYPFRFPSGKRVRIKDLRTPTGTIASSDIARKCVEDLGQRGLVLVDEDDPQGEAELKQLSMGSWEAFARSNIAAYNELNIELANEGRPKARAPRDLTDLVLKLKKHCRPDASDDDARLMADQAFQRISKASEDSRAERLEAAKQAFMRGDMQALHELLGDKANVLPAGSGETPGEDANLDQERMETEVVEVSHPKGHKPGQPPRQARNVGGPGLRKGGKAAAAGG